MEEFHYSFESAHPVAQALMKEEFYWDPADDFAPFGNDDGFDAAYNFRNWRMANPSLSPVQFLRELMANWNYAILDWNELDPEKIMMYVDAPAEMDEATVQERMQMTRDAFANSMQGNLSMDDATLRQIVLTASGQMNGRYLLGMDNAIIGTAFAQVALEGKIDHTLKRFTDIAIKRQSLPELVSKYEQHLQEERRNTLILLQQTLDKVSIEEENL